MKTTLSELLCYLVSGLGNNFYARVLTALELRESPSPFAMTVGVEDRKFILSYDPDWFRRASYDEALAVIEHEVCHLIWEHVPRCIELQTLTTTPKGNRDIRYALNIAADMAVNTLLERTNSYIRKHRLEFILPDCPENGFDFPPYKAMEWYFEALMDRARQQPKGGEYLLQLVTREDKPPNENAAGAAGVVGNGSKEQQPEREKGNSANGEKPPQKENKRKKSSRGIGFDLLANHEYWQGEADRAADSIENQLSLADELRHKLKRVVSKAIEDHVKNRGTIPRGLQEQIDTLMKEPRIPFTRILRNWVVITHKYRRRRSSTRIKRRHIGIPELYPFPGFSKQRKFRVVWCIDTSGSMGSEELEMGLNELRGLQKADPEIEVHVIEADCAVEHEYLLDRPETRINYEVHGRGGTSFDPALLRAQQLQPDICFYFTDGYAPAPEVSSRVSCPFVWVLTPHGTNPDGTWGHVIETKYK